MMIRLYKKHDKEYLVDFNGDYYREIPASYGPATVGYLIRGNINDDDLSASIMDLINKNVIDFIKLDKNNYKFIKKNINFELTNSQLDLMKFLFNEKDEITLDEIKKISKNDYNDFLYNYLKWKDSVKNDAINENFYEDKTKPKVKNIFLVLTGMLFPMISLVIKSNYILYNTTNIIIVILSVLIFVLIIYIILFTKKTKKGMLHYKKWIGLKNFMKDFGNFDNKELPEIKLWKTYLVYSITLGVADTLSKNMNLKISQLSNNNYIEDDLIFQINYVNNMIIFNKIIDKTISKSIENAYGEKSRIEANQNMSSSSGFGGGFSGGGSFGGGGGGGGRF